MDIYYIDRATGEKKKEIVAGDKVVKWVYNTTPGKTLLETLLKRRLISSFLGFLYSQPFSRNRIADFVSELEIDIKEAEKETVEEYKNFNDFFIRTLKEGARPVSGDNSHLVSPADGRILAYENININKLVQVKGQEYTLDELLKDEKLAQEFRGGVCLVIRLNPSDYHRFHFPDSGIPETARAISGDYYSVNPLALQEIPRVYCRNKREVTIFNSEHFNQMAYIEVGATAVGSIVQTYKPGESVKKGQEKGYFKFGGSTVILFIKKGNVSIDKDILANSQKGLETKVKMGERIGTTIFPQ